MLACSLGTSSNQKKPLPDSCWHSSSWRALIPASLLCTAGEKAVVYDLCEWGQSGLAVLCAPGFQVCRHAPAAGAVRLWSGPLCRSACQKDGTRRPQLSSCKNTISVSVGDVCAGAAEDTISWLRLTRGCKITSPRSCFSKIEAWRSSAVAEFRCRSTPRRIPRISTWWVLCCSTDVCHGKEGVLSLKKCS